MPKPSDWRERAAELRRLADDTDDPERRRKLLGLADRLEQVADEEENGGGRSSFSS